MSRLFEVFLPKDTQLPKTNPPYSSSMFLGGTKHIISIISYILSYHYDQWVDETIIGFLLIFTTGEQPIIFNYNQFIIEVMHH